MSHPPPLGLWPWRRRGRPLLFGHRGVRGDGPPENTLAAFERAADEAADAIELDVRTCKSGELVVIHDPTLARVTEHADVRSVGELGWDELRRVDIGQGQRVPLLVDVLELARGRRLSVNVEMKRDAPDRTAIVASTARTLDAWDPRHPVLVSSFDPFMLAGLRLLCRRPRALLMHRDARWHQRTSGFARPLGAVAVHLERTLASPATVRRWQRRGLLVNVWTVNDAVEARDLAAAGVDGIITDVPRRVREALADRAC